MTVAFDLEGTEPLDGSLDMIETYYDLGVRTMLMAYNEPNRAGGGCHGDPEIGLTAFGQAVVREMNRIGMLVDATHCSRRTTFDFFELSEAPVVFSHSVPAGLKKHPRNVGLGYSTDAIKGILGGTSIEWQTRSGARLRAK
ncbi:MAG TPA: membrane dipeptidase [Candidatus Dormibacteraeota bacterium]|nr:membrane dipeptidase [Candidatus Dormibacteraeota bacterium]